MWDSLKAAAIGDPFWGIRLDRTDEPDRFAFLSLSRRPCIFYNRCSIYIQCAHLDIDQHSALLLAQRMYICIARVSSGSYIDYLSSAISKLSNAVGGKFRHGRRMATENPQMPAVTFHVASRRNVGFQLAVRPGGAQHKHSHKCRLQAMSLYMSSIYTLNQYIDRTILRAKFNARAFASMYFLRCSISFRINKLAAVCIVLHFRLYTRHTQINL